MSENTPQFVEDLREAAPDYFKELQKLAPTAVIDLFEVRLTEGLNGDGSFFNNGTGKSPNRVVTLRYHAGTNRLVNNIVFDGKTYSAVPVEMTGLQTSGKGIIARPTLKVANANGAISSLLVDQAITPLKAQVVRIRTFKKFLDVENFPGAGGNPTADPAAKTEEIWYIDRVAEENLEFVEFELTAKLDLTNLELPRRQVTEFCPWKYRGTECGYVAKKYFQVDDIEISKALMQSLATTNGLTFDRAVDKFDVCGKRVSSCRLRFPKSEGKNDIGIPFGGFLGSRVQA